VTKRKKNSVPGNDPAKSNQQLAVGDDSGKPVAVRLADNLTVNGINSTYDELSQYLKGSGTLLIDASGVQAIDTAGIQLLLAFTREIAEQDRLVEWQSPSSEFLQIVELLNMKEELGL
jgi:ABC-type transporter Mla MlaB component